MRQSSKPVRKLTTAEPKNGQSDNLFNIFLDASGILLGVFLVGVGTWARKQRYPPTIIWHFLTIAGVCAFLIHLFHYLGWNIRTFLGLKWPTE